MSGDTGIYLAIGPRMVCCAFEAATMQVTPLGEVTLPARVRHACVHPRLPLLYAACGVGETSDRLVPLRRQADGTLHQAGEAVPLPACPMEVAINHAGDHLVVAYDTAPGLTVHRLRADGSIAEELPRSEPFDTGFKTHSVAILPSDTHGIVVSLGMRGFGTGTYVDGALGRFRFDRGSVESLSLAVPPTAGEMGGFNPRNVALHPRLPLAYISIEGQNMLGVCSQQGNRIEPELLHVHSTLADPGHVRQRQNLGAILLHPREHALYLANRNDGYLGGHQGPAWRNPDPIPVFPGGENNIAVFRLDAETGVPTLAQHIDTRGIHPRSISLSPDGRVLMAATCSPTRLDTGEGLRDVPAGLTFYQVEEDGTLRFAHQHGVDVGPEKLWWSQMVAL